MRKLTLVPLCGLCNRMRNISSGLMLARCNGISRVQVWWTRTDDMKIPYEELFEPIRIPGMDVRVKTPCYIVYYVMRGNNKLRCRLIRRFFFTKQIVCKTFIKGAVDVQSELPAKGDVYIASCESLGEEMPYSSIFVPRREIREIIERVCSGFGPNTIGIHIRRTDNSMAIEHNSVDDFYRYMEDEISRDPSVKFFLATDSAEVKQELSDAFGERVVTYGSELTRESVRGLMDAVVELWCLASTRFVVGSYWSSYTEVAASIGGIEYIILERGGGGKKAGVAEYIH